MKRKLVAPGLAVAAALLAALVVGGITRAAIPGPGGVIHGCMKTKGQLYLVDPAAGQTCKQDTPLDWNEPGPSGPQGTDGPQGFAGGSGPSGSSGYETQHVQSTTDGNGDGSDEADCSTGKVALAGGYELQVGLKPVHTGPTSDGSGWAVEVTGKSNAVFSVYAICATNGGS